MPGSQAFVNVAILVHPQGASAGTHRRNRKGWAAAEVKKVNQMSPYWEQEA